MVFALCKAWHIDMSCIVLPVIDVSYECLHNLFSLGSSTVISRFFVMCFVWIFSNVASKIYILFACGHAQ